MIIEIGSKLKITDPSRELLAWCKDNLEMPNPEYSKRLRMNLWTGNTPTTLVLYETDGNAVILPYGCLRAVLSLSDGEAINNLPDKQEVPYEAHIPLYDYQEKAVKIMKANHYGILQSSAGSGKTQMGIALACELNAKTLWLTHTKDLLMQSKSKAEQYISPDIVGTITEGRVNVGTGITFATVQTMCKLDLEQYRDTWDCIIVDECHRVSGTPTAVTQFSKVLNTLRARHKYGLSATVHRSDGLIKATYALLGEVIYTVPNEAVRERIMTVSVKPVETGVRMSTEYLNPDGTTNYARLINYLTQYEERNDLIMTDLAKNGEHYNLILSDRVEHLKELCNRLPPKLRATAVVINGKMTSKKAKVEREQAIEGMRHGKNHYLFATYALAKEGLDIPRLDRLYLTTPQKDYAVIAQSIGRVARVFEGKKLPLVYDYVDSIRSLQKAYKTRCTTYNKCGCRMWERMEVEDG